MINRLLIKAVEDSKIGKPEAQWMRQSFASVIEYVEGLESDKERKDKSISNFIELGVISRREIDNLKTVNTRLLARVAELEAHDARKVKAAEDSIAAMKVSMIEHEAYMEDFDRQEKELVAKYEKDKAEMIARQDAEMLSKYEKPRCSTCSEEKSQHELEANNKMCQFCNNDWPF